MKSKVQSPKSKASRSNGFGLCALVIGGFLAGCATSNKPDATAPPAANLVWPQPPDPPRIAYVRSIGGPADVGIKPSGFTRFGNWLTGSRAPGSQLVTPFGVALDEDDNLCLTDAGANVVCFYDRTHTKWTRWEKV